MATIAGSRSILYWKKIPGGLPSIVDVSKFSGNIFFVDSNVGTDAAGYGYHPDYPFDSIDYAVGQCTANQGDVILVLPGHVETVSAVAGLALDVAGITIIFCGHGNARGSIQFGTDVDADMDVDAADITIINPRFVAAIDALTGPIDINAARFSMIGGGPGCRVTCQDGTAINTTDWVVGDANADDCLIEDIEFIDGDGNGTQKQSFIQFAAATRPTLRRVRATGDFGTGVIENGTAWVDALLDDIMIDNTAAGPVVGILLQATSSGAARNVNVRVASGTTYVTANNDMQWFECYGVGTDAQAGDRIGTEASASIEGKVDSVGTQAGSVGTQAGSVGTQVTSVGTLTTSVGTQATSIGAQADSIGTQATSVGTLTTSVGTLVGTDVASVGTLITSVGTQATSIGAQSDSIGTQATSVGTLATSVGTQATSIGAQSDSIGTQATSVGTLVTSVGTQATSIGAQADSIGTQTGSVGTLATSVGMQVTALIDGAKVFKATIADGTTIPNNSQAAGGLLATATDGDILIEEIIWQRGATNFVGPTNYEFSTDNVAGLTGAAGPNVVALLVKFNAAVTSIASLDGATKQLPFVLESTKKLYIHGDDAATSSGGTTDFYIRYRPLVAGATLA